jgi:hypothetical protein
MFLLALHRVDKIPEVVMCLLVMNLAPIQTKVLIS